MNYVHILSSEIKQEWIKIDDAMIRSVEQWMDLVMGTVETIDDLGIVDSLIGELKQGLSGYERLLDRAQESIDTQKQQMVPDLPAPPPGVCSEWELCEISECFYELYLDDYQAKRSVIESLLRGEVPTPQQRQNYESLWTFQPLLSRRSLLDPIQQKLKISQFLST